MTSRWLIFAIFLFGGQLSAQDDHWAFQPIKRPKLPAENSPWCRTPIDRFVWAKLREKKLQPSPRADINTLLRRLYLDLVGLPPTWPEVQRFLHDKRPDRYQRLVDRLLASPRYGERWGRHWLDVARFADSSGYEADRPRDIWRYRDWVIQAVNKGMPFDQFIIEQLAGDLLPKATEEQRIATGFHCNAMRDPGVHWESVVDRVETTGAALLGLTLGCARCHTHKTDPVTHREFFQFFAFFNQTSILKLPLRAKKKDGKPWTTLVLQHAPVPTHIFIQGDPARPGKKVEPGVPAFLPKLPQTKGSSPNRLDLAKWMFHPKHPLTARVTANRIWQRFFGLGLVETENDFGVQTAPPTHPKLLDYLASELKESGWQLKQLHRRIVLSAVYQQSSNLTKSLEQVDQRNRWLARQSRLRLEAELIRDLPLAVSGLLDHRIGGPSVFPTQPRGILKNRATPATWVTSKGGDRYRRSLYTWVWRLTPHPHLPLFDAPDGVATCTRRHRTNNSVQALTSLNDPVFVLAARSLANKLIADKTSTTTQQRLCLLFQHCLSRKPTREETAILTRLANQQHQSLSKNPTSVRQMLNLPASATINKRHTTLAKWLVLCRVVMNVDEMITRE